MNSRDSCCTAMILVFPAPAYRRLVSAVVVLLILFPVSVGSRPATGHADVVVDNWTLSTVEDYECVAIFKQMKASSGGLYFFTSGRKEGGRA